MSRTAVLPIVTPMKLYGGRWPDVAARTSRPSCSRHTKKSDVSSCDRIEDLSIMTRLQNLNDEQETSITKSSSLMS